MSESEPSLTKNKLLLAAIVVAAAAIAAFLLTPAEVLAPLSTVTASLRWLAIVLFAGYATTRRSLTA